MVCGWKRESFSTQTSNKLHKSFVEFVLNTIQVEKISDRKKDRLFIAHQNMNLNFLSLSSPIAVQLWILHKQDNISVSALEWRGKGEKYHYYCLEQNKCRTKRVVWLQIMVRTYRRGANDSSLGGIFGMPDRNAQQPLQHQVVSESPHFPPYETWPKLSGLGVWPCSEFCSWEWNHIELSHANGSFYVLRLFFNSGFHLLKFICSGFHFKMAESRILLIFKRAKPDVLYYCVYNYTIWCPAVRQSKVTVPIPSERALLRSPYFVRANFIICSCDTVCVFTTFFCVCVVCRDFWPFPAFRHRVLCHHCRQQSLGDPYHAVGLQAAL